MKIEARQLPDKTGQFVITLFGDDYEIIYEYIYESSCLEVEEW